MPAFYTERFQWHGDRPSEPSPPPAVIDDKLNLPREVADDSSDRPERFGVKIEYWHTDEIADSCRLRKALQIALLHRHPILCVHHAGPRDHGLSQHYEAAARLLRVQSQRPCRQPPRSPMNWRRLVCRESSILRGDRGRFTTPLPSRLEARSRLRPTTQLLIRSPRRRSRAEWEGS
jgi:hypothetical protein